eukprot:5429327-Pyramimonas_sp.AAC.1
MLALGLGASDEYPLAAHHCWIADPDQYPILPVSDDNGLSAEPAAAGAGVRSRVAQNHLVPPGLGRCCPLLNK